MKLLVVWLIRFYQKYLNSNGIIFRPLFPGGRACRFSPSCSQYCLEAVQKYGCLKGLVLGLKRVLKCHPWSVGGSDPVG